MKVYIARDWNGCHVYTESPKFCEHLPSFPPTWTGHRLDIFNVDDYDIPCNKVIEVDILWGIVRKFDLDEEIKLLKNEKIESVKHSG